MKATARLVMVLVVVVSVGATARADWDPGDGHKMHYPQLPDPNGWDVRVSNAVESLQWIVADDWQCSETGPVEDVHLWVSWREDLESEITNVHLSIHDNIPVGPDGWSIPGNLLWQRDLSSAEFTVRHYGTGNQGWFNPPGGEWWEDDHNSFYQINVDPIPDPFIQQIGEIYWLDVSVDLVDETELFQLGWKTSLDHYMDGAVYWDMIDQKWVELRDPVTTELLDMAFVITGEGEPPIPEPAGLGLIGLVALAARRRRR